MKSFRFTFQHGFLASLAIHAAIVTPLLLQLSAREPDDDDTLVVELQGLESDVQADEKLLRQTSGAPSQQASTPQKALDAQTEENSQTDATTVDPGAERAEGSQAPSPAAQATAGAPGSMNMEGEDQRQRAQTIRLEEQRQADLLRLYVKYLSKRIQKRLVYPERVEGLQGVTTVSFTILPNGDLGPNTLKVVTGSGRAELDDSALKTIRACAPFAPPPKAITPTLAVSYGRKR